jgi:prepilin-type N-terminal cleavage/methylation domain-containing protein
MKKSGFTLMELLVYMAIVGIVVVIAGEAFSNSTKFRIRTDNMIRATQEAENVGMVFREDVAQMGAKSSKESGLANGGAFYGVKFSAVNAKIYMDPDNIDDGKKDSSSFLLEKDDDGYSDLTIRRLRYDDNGYYQAIEEIRWFVENRILKRTCRILELADGVSIDESTDPCAENAPSVEMATGVTIFNVEAASPGVKEEMSQLFPPDGMDEFRLVPRVGDGNFVNFKAINTAGSEVNGGTSITLSGFTSNYVNSDDPSVGGANVINPNLNQAVAIKDESGAGVWNALCDQYGKMTLHPDTVYEISFGVSAVDDDDKSMMFVPEEDHMSVGFRVAGSGDYAKVNNKVILPDFLFFPPLDATKGNGKRTMRFTVPEKVENVCVAFTFACFSPLVSQGKISINDLKVKQIASANYKFNGFDPEFGNNKKEKKNVKALKLRLQVSRGAKNGGKGETGDVNLIVATPSNGPRD